MRNTCRQQIVCVLRQQQISDCVVQTWHICPQPFWVGQEKVTSDYAVCVRVRERGRGRESEREEEKTKAMSHHTHACPAVHQRGSAGSQSTYGLFILIELRHFVSHQWGPKSLFMQCVRTRPLTQTHTHTHSLMLSSKHVC